MKRNLFAIGLIATSFQLNAQDLIYVGQSAKFYVENKTLVYSGGNLLLDSNIEKTIENKGNIVIVGDYKKGTKTTNAAADGKEFVNIWTELNNYGQVKILNTNGALTNGKMTMEKPAASANYHGNTFPFSVPFKDGVENIVLAFGKPTTEFKGDCALNVDCGGQKRYQMTLFKWNNDKIHNDAVPTGQKFKAGDYYFLNLIPTDFRVTPNSIVNYKGTPAPETYVATGESVIHSMDKTTFSNTRYNDWKTLVNPYNERYESYMGRVHSSSFLYGKNVYRFGNPYTSNLDLRGVDGDKAWLKILNGGEKTLKQAHEQMFVKDFFITKRTPTYKIIWNAGSGSRNTNEQFSGYYSAKYDGTNWVGNPEALYIRPTETFNLNFPIINPTNLGSRIVSVKVEFNDNHKTFDYPAVTTVPVNITPLSAKKGDIITTASSSEKIRVSNASNNINAFNQLEIFLLSNNDFEATPIYLVGTNYNSENSTSEQTTNKVFLYGMKDGKYVENSKKTFNGFNSIDYVGKPLSIGFNNLEVGKEYEMRFNQYEVDIFTSVKNLSDGLFLIKDNETGRVTPLSSETSFKFVANSNDMKGRFDFYWREAKDNTLTSVDAEVTSGRTSIYKYLGDKKVRFERVSKSAKLQIYDMSGKQIFVEEDVRTDVDYLLPSLPNGGYIINVIYTDGVTKRILKTIY